MTMFISLRKALPLVVHVVRRLEPRHAQRRLHRLPHHHGVAPAAHDYHEMLRKGDCAHFILIW
jgi:hypothetical protein